MLSHAKSTIHDQIPALNWSQNITSTGNMANRRDISSPLGKKHLTPNAPTSFKSKTFMKSFGSHGIGRLIRNVVDEAKFSSKMQFRREVQ